MEWLFMNHTTKITLADRLLADLPPEKRADLEKRVQEAARAMMVYQRDKVIDAMLNRICRRVGWEPLPDTRFPPEAMFDAWNYLTDGWNAQVIITPHVPTGSIVRRTGG